MGVNQELKVLYNLKSYQRSPDYCPGITMNCVMFVYIENVRY